MASGTKQLRMAIALFTHDHLTGRVTGDYLSRSAAQLRTTAQPSPSASVNHVDNHLRLTLSGDGPMFLAEDSVRRSPPHRRVGNLYYDRDFAQCFARHLLLTGRRLQSALNSVQLEQHLAGNCLGI